MDGRNGEDESNVYMPIDPRHYPILTRVGSPFLHDYLGRPVIEFPLLHRAYNMARLVTINAWFEHNGLRIKLRLLLEYVSGQIGKVFSG